MRNVLSRKKKKRIYLVPEDAVLVLQALVCLRFHHLNREACLSVQQQKNMSKTGNVVCALYFFVMTTSLTLLLKAKEEGQGTLQPIFTNNSRYYCSRTDCFVYIQLHFNNIRIIKMTPDRPGRH